jgi:beta-N-acetylhexosaminidase
MTLACILDVEGPVLSDDERHLFAASDPWGFILFGRSCETPEQFRQLCADLRAAVGRHCLIFIDQEGGRVQRLGPPVWPQFPPVSLYGKIYERSATDALRACYLHHRLMGYEMAKVHINATCAPCLDLAIEDGHSVIGDRAFSARAEIVAALGKVAIEGLRDAGIASVAKHMPGHGRAQADSHAELPRIEVGSQALAQDISIFKALASAPMAMTAHVIFDALDEDHPASLSPTVISKTIRTDIGFEGLLMTDDISMKALSATNSQVDNADAAFEAGIDVAMFCHGSVEARLAFIAACPKLSGKSLERAQRAQNFAPEPQAGFDPEAAWKEFGTLTGLGRTITYSLTPDPTAKAWA